MADSAKEHRTASRVTRILETVARNPDGVVLAVLAEELNAPKSSLYGLAQGLAATGYLREQHGVYRLGPALAALVPLPQTPELDRVAAAEMRRLVDLVSETVVLATRVGESMVFVSAAHSDQSIRYSPVLHTRRPLLPTCTGKAILAFDPPEKRERIVNKLIADAAARDRVRAELDQARETRAAYNRGETVPDLSAVASPIRIDGSVTTALLVGGPLARVEPKFDEITEALLSSVARIEAEISG